MNSATAIKGLIIAVIIIIFSKELTTDAVINLYNRKDGIITFSDNQVDNQTIVMYDEVAITSMRFIYK